MYLHILERASRDLLIDIAFRFLVLKEAIVSLAFVVCATLTFASRLLVVWESPLVNPVILGLASNP